MSRGPGELGIYGKIEAQADFFRVNAGAFSQAGLDRWFEEAVETMRAEGGQLPDGATRFLLAPRGGAQIFLGVFSPSHDAAGRSAPLVVFTAIEAGSVGDSLPALLDEHAPFLARIGALCLQGVHLQGEELGARARATATATASALAGEGAEGAAAATGACPDGSSLAEPARDLSAAFGAVPRAVGYALRTMGLACDQATKAGPDARSGVVTVDAPWSTPAVLRAWLELVRRRLRWRQGMPSLIWTEGVTEGAPGRLLVTLGPPSGSVLAYLANPRHRSPRFWPLRTDVKAAWDQAYDALSPEQRRLVENPAVTLAELTTAFGSPAS